MHDMFYFPIWAAVFNDHFETTKWLFNHGARADIRRLSGLSGYPKFTPFAALFPVDDDMELPFSRKRNTTSQNSIVRTQLAKWFILNGGMDNGNGHVDSSIVIASFEGVPDLRGCWGGPDGIQTFLVDWCDDLLRRNESVYTFLLGTRPSPEYSVQVLRQLCARRLRNTTAASLLIDSAIASGRCRAVGEELQQTQPTNARLASYPGISECIAEYVGFIKSRAQTKKVKGISVDHCNAFGRGS